MDKYLKNKKTSTRVKSSPVIAQPKQPAVGKSRLGSGSHGRAEIDSLDRTQGLLEEQQISDGDEVDLDTAVEIGDEDELGCETGINSREENVIIATPDTSPSSNRNVQTPDKQKAKRRRITSAEIEPRQHKHAKTLEASRSSTPPPRLLTTLDDGRWPDCNGMENQLRLFDLDLRYGPCIGITRVREAHSSQPCFSRWS